MVQAVSHDMLNENPVWVKLSHSSVITVGTPFGPPCASGAIAHAYALSMALLEHIVNRL